MRYLQTKYKNWIIEAKSVDRSEEIERARKKVAKAIMWINITMGFYAELLSHVAIYGSYESPTMWTDCRTYIAYNPKYVDERPDEQIRYTLIHEILHVLLQHDKRRGSREHEVWNEACDYALNPIIHSESRFGKTIQPPSAFTDGKWDYSKPIILYDEKFDGMRAEDIYDILIEEYKSGERKKSEKTKEAAAVGQFGPEEFEPVEGSVVQDFLEEEYVDPDDEEDMTPSAPPTPGKPGEEGEEGEGQPTPGQPGGAGKGKPMPGKPEGQGEGEGEGEEGNGKPAGSATIMGMPTPGVDGNAKNQDPHFHKEVMPGGIPKGSEGGNRVSRANDVGDQLSGDAKEWKARGKSKVLRRKSTNWDAVKKAAFSRSGASMSDRTRRLIQSAIGDKAVVDWENELRKWYDHCLNGREVVIPNKRLLASGMVTYGTKKTGLSGLRTIVAAIDTSGSISEDQKMTFLNEVTYLAKKHNSDRLVIIYCSDDIDGHQIVKKGQKIDISLMKSTGGNDQGFVPPFKWCYENNIKPSVFIYLTDTGGLMPDKTTYGISKFMNKVIWFICSPQVYNPPPFGKCIFMPVGSINKGKHTRPEKL